ncbi:D-alanyl-lipoteichoic acid biosynthesis protein DltD [Harryflintia acetispora]|uniref:D-alanyl-lipoteichoic acid biosynthesis protein DltD n=1 Tax=Harryflintia acetispora TaxID=1849041 RepID=UPI00189C4579|nr:D-alanyl-lipoteichoic acid biosynthesis protein DltD [Harryflintia acetispora]
MRTALRQVFLPAAVLLLCTMLVLAGVGAILTGSMPPYLDAVGESSHTEKITGRYLLQESAARDDALIIFGSSELRTTEISTHPANFFAGKRAGFQVNLIGRGSCQSIIHAIQIAASGDSLSGKKVALITSPQSYVPEGIAPDLFLANFSPQQYLELLADGDLSPEVKRAISARVAELFREYEALPDAAATDPAIRWRAEHRAGPGLLSGLRDAALTPYYALRRVLYDLKDRVSARRLLESSGGPLPAAGTADIDWAVEEQAAINHARQMTGNNDFGMLDDYYTTYIGSRLQRQRNRDAALNYSVSEEYGDLRLLFEVCRQKGVEPLFIHVPLHGRWSDYTGFSAGRRQQYYENVRSVAAEYGVETLDLTGREYEEFFMCDVMHLGWKGWLEVDRALIKFYYE